MKIDKINVLRGLSIALLTGAGIAGGCSQGGQAISSTGNATGGNATNTTTVSPNVTLPSGER